MRNFLNRGLCATVLFLSFFYVSPLKLFAEKTNSVDELSIEALPDEPLTSPEGEGATDLLAAKDREIEELRRALVSAAERRESDPEYLAKLSHLQLRVQGLEEELKASKIRMYYNLGTMHMRLKEFVKAEAALLEVLKLDPDDAGAHYNLGILFDDHLERSEAAERHYLRFLELESSGPDAEQVTRWLRQLRATRLRP